MQEFPWIDGSIVGLYLVATMAAGIMVRKYVGKVEHFLVAGREVNVYLGIASLAATEFGVITCMYTAQLGYNRGFAGATPGILMAIAMFFVGLTGFCVKPLREAGVMTIPELFEKRYGPRIRWAAGVVIVLGGLLNMGVFLRITGEFLVLVCGFDMKYLEIMMTVLLVLVTLYTVLGGMLSVLITDFLQFIVMSAGLIAVTVLILVKVTWSRLAETVATQYAAGGFNPFANPDADPDRGWPWVLSNALMNLAAVLTWQTTISRLLSAKDAKTGRQIYTRTSFFFVCRFLIPGIWGIAAMAMLAPAAYLSLGGQRGATDNAQLTLNVERKAEATDTPAKESLTLNGISTNDLGEPADLGLELATRKGGLTVTRVEAGSHAAKAGVQVDDRIVRINNMEPSRYAMPLFLSGFVPVGLMGLLLAAMLAADMSTTSSYMLTWGSVIYNDIMAPLRKTPWSEKRGILWNRIIVTLIGVFLLGYGLWYKLQGDVWNYLVVTATIYAASISTMLVACCYWKRSNNWGAAASILVGAVIPVVYLVMEKVPATAAIAGFIGPHYSVLAAFAATALAMVVGSLLKPTDQWPTTAGTRTDRS